MRHLIDPTDLSVAEIGQIIALAEDIIAGFKTLIPFYHYFNKLVALTPRQERRGEDA